MHSRSAVHDVGVAASRQHDVLQCLIVEFAGGVEIEVKLVVPDSEFEEVVKVVGEIVVGTVDVAESLEVFLEFS